MEHHCDPLCSRIVRETQIFFKHDILRQNLVHLRDKAPKHKLSSIVCVVQCSEDLYIVATKQPFNRCMAQDRRAMPTGAVHLHLKDKEHSPEDASIHILDQ